MRKAIASAALAGALIAPAGAHATHGGCLVHSAQTTCTYTPVASHSATGYSQGPWEVSVVRTVNGEQTKVIVGGGAGGPIVASGVTAAVGERATIEMKPAAGAPAAVGVISVGNTAGHP
ncbi:MAG TPA: hypothetical protein VM600_10630 [Actinomycetota bacterium]|nr:hypothetical protein [Actinomycetota bacterium]